MALAVCPASQGLRARQAEGGTAAQPGYPPGTRYQAGLGRPSLDPVCLAAGQTIKTVMAEAGCGGARVTNVVLVI